jgi:hypothetical protein
VELKDEKVMEDLKIRLELEPMVLGSVKLTHLEIEVSHDKGGFGLGDTIQRRGVRCDVHPIKVEDFNGSKIYGRIFDGQIRHQGFFTFLIDCEKKSPKKMKMAFERIKPHAEEIKDLFIRGNYNGIAQLVKNAVGDGK